MSTEQSNLLSNQTADPQVMNDGALDGGFKRVKIDSLEADTSTQSSTGDTIELCDLPTNAVVHAIRIANDALDSGSGLTIDVGLWNVNQTTGAIGSAANDNVYADNSTDFQTATSAWTDYAFSNRNRDQAAKKVWEDAGDSSDPGGVYRLALKVEASPTTGQTGTVSFQVEYSVPA